MGILAANYGVSGDGIDWTMGDFNVDGVVDVGDLGILAANYGVGTGAALASSNDAEPLGLSIESARNPCSFEGLVLILGVLMSCLGLTRISVNR